MKINENLILLTIAIVVLSGAFRIINTKHPKINPNKERGGIQFMKVDWNTALSEAKKQNKLVFLDAYASWCGPCKLLKNKTFPDNVVGSYFNQQFINVAIDMEKGEGPSLASRYHVDAYPTLIVTDAQGNLVAFTQGYMSPKDLLDFGKTAVKKSSNGR